MTVDKFFDEPDELTPVTGRLPLRAQSPTWYSIAQREIGIKEGAGHLMNPRIAEYYDATDIGKVSDDAVAWCSAFVNWCMREAGIRGTRKAAARSWMTWGTALHQPMLGCVVVFSRPPIDWQGHVSLYVGETSTGDIRCLGGNQNNAVCTATYKKDRLLGYRWPTAADFMQQK